MTDPTQSDAVAGFQVGPAFEAFTQRSNFDRRSFWGATVHSAKTGRGYRAYPESLAHGAPQGFDVRAVCDICHTCNAERLVPGHGWKGGKAQ